MPPTTIKRMRLPCTCFLTCCHAREGGHPVATDFTSNVLQWLLDCPALRSPKDSSRKSLLIMLRAAGGSSRAMTRNKVSGQHSKEERKGYCRKGDGADPDAEAACAVLTTLRLGQTLDRVVVEPQALVEHGRQGVGRAFGLAEKLRDVTHEAPDRGRPLGRGLDLRARAELLLHPLLHHRLGHDPHIKLGVEATAYAFDH